MEMTDLNNKQLDGIRLAPCYGTRTLKDTGLRCSAVARGRTGSRSRLCDRGYDEVGHGSSDSSHV